MCDISKNTLLDTVTVYKAVSKNYNTNICEIEYHGAFSNFRVEVGEIDIEESIQHANTKYRQNDYFNQYMIGRCCGFERIESALIIKKTYKLDLVILKIVLKASDKLSIMQGTGFGMTRYSIIDDSIVYAGPIIESMEEVNELI